MTGWIVKNHLWLERFAERPAVDIRGRIGDEDVPWFVEDGHCQTDTLLSFNCLNEATDNYICLLLRGEHYE